MTGWLPAARHVLLIGGAGYIGTVLTQELLGRGFCVRWLDSFIYGHNAVAVPYIGNRAFSAFVGDFRESLGLYDITDVVILAGLVGDPICKKYPDEARETNLFGIGKLIDALNGRKLERVIFASTCSNYGEVKDGAYATEDTPLNPLSAYAYAKVMAEEQILAHDYDFCPTILRFATAFGLSPRMRFDLTVSEFTRELWAGNVLEVYDPDTWRPYVHVRDIASAIATVLEARTDQVRKQVFNVGHDWNNRTKRQVSDAALDNLYPRLYPRPGFRIRETWQVRFVTTHSRDRRDYRVSFDKMARVLGWRAKTTVEQGIDELLNALNAHCFDDYEARRGFYRNETLRPHDEQRNEGDASTGTRAVPE